MIFRNSWPNLLLHLVGGAQPKDRPKVTRPSDSAPVVVLVCCYFSAWRCSWSRSLSLSLQRTGCWMHLPRTLPAHPFCDEFISAVGQWVQLMGRPKYILIADMPSITIHRRSDVATDYRPVGYFIAGQFSEMKTVCFPSRRTAYFRSIRYMYCTCGWAAPFIDGTYSHRVAIFLWHPILIVNSSSRQNYFPQQSIQYIWHRTKIRPSNFCFGQDATVQFICWFFHSHDFIIKCSSLSFVRNSLRSRCSKNVVRIFLLSLL